MNFSPNDRVRVSTEHHWARGASATICAPPLSVVSVAEGWTGLTRTVESLRGPLTFYWVQFDEPQRDADGDGPYIEAEIEAVALDLISYCPWRATCASQRCNNGEREAPSIVLCRVPQLIISTSSLQ